MTSAVVSIRVYWCNAREYLAGAVMLVVFAGMVVTNHSRMLACVGFACVSFVMIYIWWKHRGLHPLDPAADIASYRAALLARYDEQIRLLRSVPCWYLLPLFLPQVVLAVDLWPRMRWLALVSVLVTLGAFAFVGWLNVKLGVAHLRKARENVESMFPVE